MYLFITGMSDDYDLDAVHHIGDEQDFEEIIAMVEDQELIWNLEEETDGRIYRDALFHTTER